MERAVVTARAEVMKVHETRREPWRGEEVG
jgi:hypothetical protein